MDTEDGFHVYRIESQLLRVKVYVDGALDIDVALDPAAFGGSWALTFGDGYGGNRSSVYWDYFSLDVFYAGGGGAATSAPVFPSIYVGIGAALGAGIVAYAARRRLTRQ